MRKRTYLSAAAALFVITLSFTWGKINTVLPGHPVEAAAETSAAGVAAPTLRSTQTHGAAANLPLEALTGRAMKVEDAVKKSDLILVGRVVDLGVPSADFPGEVYNEGAKIEVVQILKDGDLGDSFISLSFSVRALPLAVKEEAPKVGEKYIFFVKKRKKLGIKIVPATEEGVNSVINLVAAG